MIPQLTINDRGVTEIFDNIGPNVARVLAAKLGQIADGIAADARARAAAHVRFLGAKNPGSYAQSFRPGVAKSNTRVVAFVRSGHPLAHLMEEGFTITDIMIRAKAEEVMKFSGDAGDVFRRAVHRHATRVPAYPALGPAFEARKADIIAALTAAAKPAGGAQLSARGSTAGDY